VLDDDLTQVTDDD